MVVPVGVQPAVAVLPLGVRYPQVPGQIPQQQAVEQAHHPGGFPASRRRRRPESVSPRLICNRRNVQLRHRHLCFPRGLKTTFSRLQSERTRLSLLFTHLKFRLNLGFQHAATSPSPPDALLLCARSSAEKLLL